MADRYASYINQAVSNLKTKFSTEVASGQPITLADRLIATIDRTTSSVDTKAFLNSNIFGAILECGSMYDEYRQIRSQPENPYYDRLAKQFQAAKFPYGIYVETRATSIIEANKEITAISIAARRNTPTLGIWLRLRFASRQSASTNNNIISLYQTEFTNWGFQDDMGLVATTSEIQSADWATFQSSWLLWWENHVSDVTTIPNLKATDFKVK
jgi:hypothetical protein